MNNIYSSSFYQMTRNLKINFGRAVLIVLLLLFGAFVTASNAQVLVQSGFTSVLTPQYMASGTNTRLPVMYRATVTGLSANTSYRFYTQGATSSSLNGASVDFGTTNPGAGNSLFINASGTTYTYATSPSIATLGSYETFKTDSFGNYTEWFGFVNTGNARFAAGNLVYPSIVIASSMGAILHRRVLDVPITVLAYGNSAMATFGSFLKGTGSLAAGKNLVVLYDNTDGIGRPLYIAPVESIGVAIASVIAGYSTTEGSWNAIIPNLNTNGVRRIENRSVLNATIDGCATDTDGIWPTGSINTVNPSSGNAEVIISSVDAPLNSCLICPVISITANAGLIDCAGGITKVNISATGGTAPYMGTGNFTVSPGVYPYTVTDSNGCSGTTTVTIAAPPSDTVKPGIFLQSKNLLPGVTGLSSSESPYMKALQPGIHLKSILTVGDAVGAYKLVGIPDGMGAFDNGDGTFTLLVNHEINNTLGITRAHGGLGAFVSKWIINKSNLSLVSGSDLMQQVFLWDTATQSFVQNATVNFSRFCAADLPEVSAFYNSASGKGTIERIFMSGEESGNEGRGVGHIATGANAGKSYELPYLGKFSWENAVASPASGDKTIVVGLDDATGGQVYVYIGTKTSSGTDIDKAGLNNGKLFGIKVAGFPVESNIGFPAPGTRFDLFDFGNVRNKTGIALNTESLAAGVTSFLRPEDGAWDPKNPNDFYFVTTNSFNNPSRLWRLRFDNILTPETGGTIEAVLDGTEGGQQMFDNLSIDRFGKILIQEDPGNQEYLARIWQYDIARDSLFPIAYHDSTRFTTGAASFLTKDEESSGIIDMSDILGEGMSLLNVQAHYNIPGELVQGGQLLAMYNPYVFGNSTAKDTIRLTVPVGTTTATVDLGIPATADNCSVASVTNNAPASFPIGTTNVVWTVTDGSGNSSSVTQVVIVTVEANQKPIVSITSPTNNSIFAAGDLINLMATATDADGTITRVEFYNNGTKFLTDTSRPYANIFTYVEPGIYLVTAKAFDNNDDSTVTDTVRVTVTACTGTGTISAEGYGNIAGGTVTDLVNHPSFPDSPSIVTTLDLFEYGQEIGDNYGARLRGYICAPQTGDYTFFIASDDASELWLSTDDNPANKRRIAYLDRNVDFRACNTFFTQKSVAIRLLKGVRYYIETLHKESILTDHLSVAWQLPDGGFEGPISGTRLSPFTPSIVGEKSLGDGLRDAQRNTSFKVVATPNPSKDYFTVLTRSSNNEPISVRLTDIQGRVLEQQRGLAANGSIRLGEKLLSGVYFVEIRQGKNQKTLKLVKQ